jgi:hypothetical protein
MRRITVEAAPDEKPESKLMGVAWRLAEGVVRMETVEPYTFEEWRSAVDGFMEAPEFEEAAGILHDVRGLRRSVPMTEVTARVEFLSTRFRGQPRKHWGIVTGSDALYGLGRVAEALIHGSPSLDLRPFRDFAEAETWVRRRPRA